MTDIYKKLQERIDSKNILKDEPMSNHTSFRIGGVADFLIKVKSIEELQFVLKLAKEIDIPIYIIGKGTNLLVLDKGIRGFVIKLELESFKIDKKSDVAYITVGSGFQLNKLSNIALKEGLDGLESICGIPGTVGGAVRMNAGAFGKEMKDLVVSTKYMNYDGEIGEINFKEHEFEYRNSIFSKNNFIIIETTLRVGYGKREDIESKIKEYKKRRKDSQPLEYPNAGSTFKRKEGIITSKLIDECGLKGYCIGDAEVSIKHAGFIVNKGNATANDVLELVEYIKEKIKKEFNQEIELEILVLGEK